MATDRTLYLYHVSPIVNWFPVGTLGVIDGFSTSALPGVFLVTKERLSWAVEHVSDRTGLPADRLMVVTVRVRRSKLVPVRFRTAKRGLWRHLGTIKPDRIECIECATSEYNACKLPAEVFGG